MTRPMIGVSILVESTVLTSSQRSSRPYGRNHSLTACSFWRRSSGDGWRRFGCGCGADDAFGLAGWRSLGPGERLNVLLERIALCLSGLPGDGCVVGLGLGPAHQKKARKIPPISRKSAAAPPASERFPSRSCARSFVDPPCRLAFYPDDQDVPVVVRCEIVAASGSVAGDREKRGRRGFGRHHARGIGDRLGVNPLFEPDRKVLGLVINRALRACSRGRRGRRECLPLRTATHRG